jgi:hypothetical protein
MIQRIGNDLDRGNEMKKIVIGFFLIILSAASLVHAQRIANVLAKNDSGLLPSLAGETFNPDRPADEPQNFSSCARGT